jgi:hypothetical protein
MLGRTVHAALNRGLVSRLALARADIERVALSCDISINWIPRVLGSMQIRPGLGFLELTQSGQRAVYIPFVFSVSDKSLIEFTDGSMRIWTNSATLTRPAVISQTQNGNFDTTVDFWIDASESGAAVGWQAGSGGLAFAKLQGNGSAYAKLQQRLQINAQDYNVEHGLHVQIQSGPVKLRVGTTAGADDLISETDLEAGGHSLTFIPTDNNCWIELKSNFKRVTLVDSVTIDGAGALTLPSPFTVDDLLNIRGGNDSQSGDIVYLACEAQQQWQVQRRGLRSWSLVLFQPEDGPFQTQNFDESHTMTPSGLSGNVVLTSSRPFFSPAHVGGLFRLQSDGQRVEVTVTAENTFSNSIFVEESGANRKFTVSRSGTWVATVTLQRSFISADGPWEDAATYTTNGDVNFDDTLDGESTWYRIGVKTGQFTSGSISLSLDYPRGTIKGVCRVTNFTDQSNVQVEVLTDFGRANQATSIWWEGVWSGVLGFPTAVCFFEARLCFAGRDRFWASATDNFYTFDETAEGDDASFSRTIGTGAVDSCHWLLPLDNLSMGMDGSEFTVRSSSLNEPLTPANCNLKRSSTQGSAAVQAVAVDSKGFFVQRGGTRVFDFGIDDEGRFAASHISAIVPEIGQPSIVKMAVQRQPDTRIHCVRSDGTVALLIFDRVEQVTCWVEVETDGLVEDAVVLPGNAGSNEDEVYYAVNRTVNGLESRMLERWALESETRGGQFNKLADSFFVYTGTASVNLQDEPMLTHLAGKFIVVWHDGVDESYDSQDQLIYQVQDDPPVISPDFPEPWTNLVIGLKYTADWRSTKLTMLPTQAGTTLTLTKGIQALGLVLADVHAKGLSVGPDFTQMDKLPRTLEGERIGDDDISVDRDDELTGFPTKWGSDPRLCLRTLAPRPCTVMAVVMELQEHG